MKTITQIREVKELINKQIPYTEMSDEEIESVIDYKAKILANSELYKYKYESNKNTMEKMLNDCREQNSKMMKMFKEELNIAKGNTN